MKGLQQSSQLDETQMTCHSPVSKRGHPKIVVSRFGKVENREIDHILRIVEECYNRLKPHEVELLDLFVFERSSSMDAFMAKESREAGVASASFSELFFAMHDAYRGISRITLCIERMKKLPSLVKVGGIRHEVGHSVLHGNLLYYFLSLPPILSDLTSRFNISRNYVMNLLYLVSIAVKDYEVTRLLYKRGYIEDQIAYAKHMLSITEGDKLAWKMAKGEPLAEILCLVSCLKTAGCVAPLLFDKTFGEKLKILLKESLSYLPTSSSTSLLNIVTVGFPALCEDTLNNINQVACLVVESIVNHVLPVT